jgi:hypothetical protein
MVEEAMAGKATGRGNRRRRLTIRRNELHSELLRRLHEHLDSFQSVSGISLELLEKTVFPFASRGALEYLMGLTSQIGPPSL